MSRYTTQWREDGCPIDLISVLCFQHQGKSCKWTGEKSYSLGKCLPGPMALIQWIMHQDENSWFWLMAINLRVKNVQCCINNFLIYLEELFFVEIFTFSFLNLTAPKISISPTHIDSPYSSVFSFASVMRDRLLYTRLVREAKAAVGRLWMHSLLLASWTNLWRLCH